MEFCEKFEVLYGQEFVTPNMHLHCHLYDCILDFGYLALREKMEYWIHIKKTKKTLKPN